MHWYVDFNDPLPDPDRMPTLFEWCGGLPALTRMTRILYEKHVPEDALLAPLFANMAPEHPRRVARWLGEVFGGPKLYSESYGGYQRMISQHLGKALTEGIRARWVELICLSAEEAGLPMKFVLDLWSYDNVSGHADAILQRLEDGSMPCDGAWPPERVAVFRRWPAADKPATAPPS